MWTNTTCCCGRSRLPKKSKSSLPFLHLQLKRFNLKMCGRILLVVLEEVDCQRVRTKGADCQQGHRQLHRRGGGLRRVQLRHGVCGERFDSAGWKVIPLLTTKHNDLCIELRNKNIIEKMENLFVSFWKPWKEKFSFKIENDQELNTICFANLMV